MLEPQSSPGCHQPERYSREYFRSQVAELTNRLGTRSFWINPDAPFIAAQAISEVYLHADHGEEDADIYAFAIREIAMRHSYMAAAGMLPAEVGCQVPERLGPENYQIDAAQAGEG